MKVLLVHNFYQQPGGEDQVFADEGSLLESQGHEVVRFTVDNDSIEGMGRLALAAKTIWNRDVALKLRKLLRAERPAVVHFHNTFPLVSPAAYYAARSEGAAVVQGLPNYRLLCPAAIFVRDGRICEDCLGKSFAWPAVAHKCYRQSRAISAVVAGMLTTHKLLGTWSRVVDAYITLTEFSRRKFLEGGFPEAKLRVKDNFVSPDPLPGAGHGGYAIFVGRLTAEKGIRTLIEAWKQLGNLLPLKIVGDGPEAEAVRRAAEENPSIQWLGRRPMDQVLELVGDANLLVFPSEWYEGQPKVLLESFAKGTPVLASRLGSMQELVDGSNGLLFEPGSATDLSAKLREMISDPARLSLMRRASREHFEEKYTARRNYEQLVGIYRDAIAARDIQEAAGYRAANTQKAL